MSLFVGQHLSFQLKHPLRVLDPEATELELPAGSLVQGTITKIMTIDSSSYLATPYTIGKSVYTISLDLALSHNGYGNSRVDLSNFQQPYLVIMLTDLIRFMTSKEFNQEFESSR